MRLHLMRLHLMSLRLMSLHLILIFQHLICPHLCQFYQTAAGLYGIRLSRTRSLLSPCPRPPMLSLLILPLPPLLHLTTATIGILVCLLTPMTLLRYLPMFRNAMVVVQYFPKSPEVLLIISALNMLIKEL